MYESKTCNPSPPVYIDSMSRARLTTTTTTDTMNDDVLNVVSNMCNLYDQMIDEQRKEINKLREDLKSMNDKLRTCNDDRLQKVQSANQVIKLVNEKSQNVKKSSLR